MKTSFKSVAVDFGTHMTSKYCSFAGVAGRREYLSFIIPALAVAIALSFVLMYILLEQNPGEDCNLLVRYFVFLIAFVPFILPYFGVQTRRLRAMGHSPLWMLLLIIPVIGPLVLLLWSATA